MQAQLPPAAPVTLRMTSQQHQELHEHLFPDDHDEHGAVIAAAVHRTPAGVRLLAHRLFLARDGVDYVPGQSGYRMLTAEFVLDCALACSDLRMAYLAVHCHSGTDRVAFSPIDLASHERGYPALLDILDGPPVGGVVFAKNAVAGDLWSGVDKRDDFDAAVVLDVPERRLQPGPSARPAGAGVAYDRQSRLLGDRGQQLISKHKVGVIGAGGAGSIITEQLHRLGVGEVVNVDPDHLEESNLSRVVGSRSSDLHPLGRGIRGSKQRQATTTAPLKVGIAARLASETGSPTIITPIGKSVTDPAAAAALTDCDFLFLAADSMQARHVFNALVNQYLIPGVQMGVKAQLDPITGDLIDLFGVCRPVLPGVGCLWCNGLISPAALQDEATAREQRRRQRYVEDADVVAPSVITLNGVVASLATSYYLLQSTGLLNPGPLTWTRYLPLDSETVIEHPTTTTTCRECSATGRLGRGPTWPLPVAIAATESPAELCSPRGRSRWPARLSRGVGNNPQL